MDTTSYWTRSAALPRFSKLTRSCEVDVAVIGAGITGVTAAYLLRRAGQRVALVERGRCGGFDTANTTAHLTCVTDRRLRELVVTLGKELAQATWEAGRAAIDQIVTNIRTENIRCEFEWVDGYLHAALHNSGNEKREWLEQEAQLANELGFPAEFLEKVPFLDLPGVRFRHQAKFHPRKYLAALLRAIPSQDSYVFENTQADEIRPEPLAVRVGEHEIRCRYLVLATHTPLMGKANIVSATLLQTKLFLYTTYAVGARIPQGLLPEACFWDTSEPYYYLRIDRHRGLDYAILGGEDHKTGQIERTTAPYQRLEQTLRRLVPEAVLEHRWSGQVIETPDGLPYMGETASGQFVATGFGGNGMTFGTLGAMMAMDALLKRKNPWAELFDVHRTTLKGGTWNYLKENKDYPYYMLRDWMGGAEAESLQAVKPNGGKILNLNGKKVAAYRDPEGRVSLLSPICTHLKCIVAWNEAEQTWDCPCHGSRFAATGEVMAGPAEQPLEKLADQPA